MLDHQGNPVFDLNNLNSDIEVIKERLKHNDININTLCEKLDNYMEMFQNFTIEMTRVITSHSDSIESIKETNKNVSNLIKTINEDHNERFDKIENDISNIKTWKVILITIFIVSTFLLGNLDLSAIIKYLH